MKKVICLQCEDFVEYKLKEIEDVCVIKDEEVKYKRQAAICQHCHEEVWVEEVDLYNANAPIEQYCKDHGLITISEIKDLLQKYNIGKKPLSKLLGWGEITLSRYIDGQIPTKIYSDKLQSLKDPIVFYKLLEENKDKITEDAYRNALKKIENFIQLVDYEVLNEFIYYIEERYILNYTFNGGKVCNKQLCAC